MTKLARLILPVAAVAFAACGDKDTEFGGGQGAYEVEGDFALGNPEADVTVVEYASVSCGACGNWANTVYPDFKEKHIDTGEVRYVFRPFPAGNPQLYVAGTAIAICADEKTPGNFFPNIKLQFEKQEEIFRYAQLAPEQLRDQYAFIAKEGGLTETEMEECLSNDAVRARMESLSQLGYDAGVGGTPGFVVNGAYERGTFSLEQLDAQIAKARGEESAAETASEDATE